MMTTLTIRYWPNSSWKPDIPGELVDENGTVLWGHVSSTKQFLKLDLTKYFGRRAQLAQRYPDGFCLVWSEVTA